MAPPASQSIKSPNSAGKYALNNSYRSGNGSGVGHSAHYNSGFMPGAQSQRQSTNEEMQGISRVLNNVNVSSRNRMQ